MDEEINILDCRQLYVHQKMWPVKKEIREKWMLCFKPFFMALSLLVTL